LAALTAVSPSIAGVSPAPASVSASDTIDQSQFGSTGVDVRVINGGASPDTVTIVDPNTTVAGSAATSPTVSVTNGTTKVIRVSRNFINSGTGVATLQHSFTTSVTCEVERSS
jgi:Ca2+-binding RTX toxin-like protein